MPKPGQKTITIRKETYAEAEKKAKKQNQSVAAFVTDLILSKCKNDAIVVIGPQKTKEKGASQ